MNQAIQLALVHQASFSILPLETEDYTLPSSLTINNMYSQVYLSEGKAHLHVDPYLSWVMSLTLGASCDFGFRSDRKTTQTTLRINSGDVVIFNGGKVYHSVDMILKGTEPEWFKKTRIAEKGYARLNVQCRDVDTIDPSCPQSWSYLYII
jgi:hypothetical protein